MANDNRAYLSVLIRLRFVDYDGKGVWRVSMEETGTHHEVYVENIDTLFDYLREWMAKTENESNMLEG